MIPRDWFREPPRHWPLLVALLIGTFLRCVNLDASTFYGDDAEYSTVAKYLAQDPTRLEYPDTEQLGPHPFVSQPPAVLYLFSLGTRVLGDPEQGPLAISVLLGIATLPLLYAIGTRLDGRLTGCLAALFLALLPMHVELSRRAYLDAPLTFAFTLTILLAIRWSDRPTPARSLALGAAAALTAFSKLYGFLVALPLLALLAWKLWRYAVDPDLVTRRINLRALLRQSGIMGIPVILATFAYLGLLWHLQSTRDLADKLGWQAGRVASGSEVGVHPWHWYLTDPHLSLTAQFGLFLSLGAVLGAWWLFQDSWRRTIPPSLGILLLTWPLVILLFFTVSGRKEWFYILPAAPAFALLAAWPWSRAVRRLLAALEKAAPADRRFARGLVSAVLVVLFIPVYVPVSATATSVFGDQGFGRGIKEAAEWIHETDPNSSQIGTLLGRYALAFYNAQPTYNWFMDHEFIEREVAAGRCRFLVWDTYLDNPGEAAWFADLVLRFNGTSVKTFGGPEDRAPVRLVAFAPARSAA